jgi:hypothetical protein
MLAGLHFIQRTYSTATLYRRGVEVAIWGMPIVSVDAMRQAFFRDARANYCDIVYWSKPANAKFQFTTPNASTYYAYFNYNTRQGPLVLEVPAASGGARLTGSLIGAWQAPLADIGFEGEDKGQGGRYLLMPPSIARRDPLDYIAVPSDTYNGYGLLRVTPASNSESVRFDDTFFDSLARMVDEKPIQQRDLVAMGQLHSIGVQKGRPFTPDQATRDVLRRAADEAHLTFMENAMVGNPFWPDKRWLLPAIVGPRRGSRTRPVIGWRSTSAGRSGCYPRHTVGSRMTTRRLAGCVHRIPRDPKLHAKPLRGTMRNNTEAI